MNEVDDMKEQRERLISALDSLETLTKKQVSLKFILLKGVIYGLGTIIGATILLTLVSYFAVSIFGEEIENSATFELLERQL